MADIKCEQKGKMITCCRDNNFVFLKYLGKGVFLTKEEAEEKLKELGK